MFAIRNVDMRDWERVSAIEAANFSPEEAAPPLVLKKRIEKTPDTFLVAEIDQELVAYIEGPVIGGDYLTDDRFLHTIENPPTGGFLAVTSLSVAEGFQGQGLGTALLAAFKDLAIAQGREGISLTCHDYLISYYEMNGFTDHGLSQSQLGGGTWYNMVWLAPKTL